MSRRRAHAHDESGHMLTLTEVVRESNRVEADVASVAAIELGGALEEGNREVLLHPGAPRDGSCKHSRQNTA